MRRVLTMCLILTTIVGCIAGLLAKPAAARIYAVQPTNEDGGPPTDQFTTADPIFAVFKSDVEGGEICVVDNDGVKSHCKTIAAHIGTGWSLIAPGLPPGTYRLRAGDNDPDYAFLSFPFMVALCDPSDPVCSRQRRISDEIVTEWKDRAGVSFRKFGEVCSTLEVASSFRKPKIGRGFLFAKKAADDINEQTSSWGWEAGLVVVGVGYGLGFGVAAGGIATAVYKPYLAVAKELSCGVQQMYFDIRNDPPDPSYTTVVPPVFTILPDTGDAPTDRLSRTLDRQRAFGRAQLKAYEHYLGAVAAGDENSVRLQAQAIADYGQALVAEMKESASALRAWGAVQGADTEVDNPAVTQPDLDIASTIFERVRASGFTQDELNQLSTAGLSQDEIQEIRLSYTRDLTQVQVGVSVQTIANNAADAVEASIPTFSTFAQAGAWVADGRAPKTISLSPVSQSLSVGTTHIVSASVTDARNGTVAGVSVKLSVTGANPSQLTATTNGSGVATFSYVGNNVGVDTLAATAGTVSSHPAAVQWSSGPPNATPSVRGRNANSPEGTNSSYYFDFTDPDTQDTHTATIDWGDGSPTDTYGRGNIAEGDGSGFVIAFHTYADDGVYNPKATITDNHGGAGTGGSTVTVRNLIPVPGGVTLEEVNGEILFKGDFTDPGVRDTHTAEISWGDGTTSPATVTEANGSGSVSGRHVYDGPGRYTITLTVSDDDGGTASRNAGLTIDDDGLGNSPPLLQLSNYQTYEGGGSFGADFTDPDSMDIHTAVIDWGDGSPLQVLFVRENGNGTGIIFGNHIYVDNGTFEMRVTINDNHGGADTKVSPMTVYNTEPRVTLVFPSSRLVTPGDTITVRADFNDSGVRDTHTAVWNWGDGTTTAANFTESSGFGQASGSHAYMTPGVYTISLIVTDNDGATGVGTTFEPVGVYAATITSGSIKPVVTETGRISISITGLGMTGQAGMLKVEKPAGATVRKAYLGSATRGLFRYLLRPDDVKLDGVDVAWNIVTPSGIRSFNFWGEVTHIVKAKLDSAPPGRVDFSVREGIFTGVDSIEGEVLIVIFDDPNQPQDNTVVLLFGAQQTTGDTFALRFAEPLKLSDPNFGLTMSLGISYGYQDELGRQYSLIDVNGRRMTSSAGGNDDGEAANGALLTVGGFDDSPANPPDPYALGRQARADDELYDLRPFVEDGDTELTVVTSNPSNDDNIFFAALYLQNATAVVGEGIVLAPASASLDVGAQHTLKAIAQDEKGNLLSQRAITLEIVSGPHTGLIMTDATDNQGVAEFTFIGTKVGTDTAVARFVNSSGVSQTSNTVTIEWGASVNPTSLSMSGASGIYGGTTTVSARLTAAGSALSGKDVAFSFNGMSLGVAKTNSSGIATISNLSLAGNAGAHPNAITTSFAGDANYAASNATADLNIAKATLTITADNKSKIFNLANPALTFTPSGFVNGDTAVTAFSGVPNLTTVAQLESNVGTYPIIATVGTLSSVNYGFIFVTGTLAVTQAPTETVVEDHLIAQNRAANLKATLRDSNLRPIANRLVTLALGTGSQKQTCSATTDIAGIATCRIGSVAQPLGSGTLSASFAGDQNYLASAGNAATLVFDFLGGGTAGSFIVGDLSADIGKPVIFWGAQWSNGNSLSTGSAPASFKGFANRTSTNPVNCGGLWTAGPGNSSGPLGSIPSYMAVIASSSVTKSGSSIAGNVKRIVIVKTNSGYDPNSGHAGTGTVVGVWCQ